MYKRSDVHQKDYDNTLPRACGVVYPFFYQELVTFELET